ncbi:unannotated protein [freshwater metagenome]|uniref:Unannotated protein n=1 Tax=freshwater metagenome TaxID=449393 RepID=A0A6J6YJI5_9ZZZZ
MVSEAPVAIGHVTVVPVRFQVIVPPASEIVPERVEGSTEIPVAPTLKG